MISKKKAVAWSILFVFVAFMVFALCDKSFARAGGGHRYSRPSSSSSSSSRSYSSRSYSGSRSSSRSYSSSGSGDFTYDGNGLIVIFFAFLIIGIKIAIEVMQNEQNFQEKTLKRANRLPPAKKQKVSLLPLRKKDPSFDEVVFNNRAKKAFRMIQKAWSDRNLEKAEAFLSDGLYEQFSIQIAELKEKGIIDYMENLNVSDSYPVGLHSDQNFDVVHLRINAKAINYRKDDKTEKIIEGSSAPEEFAEVWSFLRKPGVKTSNKPGLMEGQCPNCGNPIKIGRLAKCDVCNALLRSGEYDWVLVNITQACEWTMQPQRTVPGVENLSEIDPGFNMQHLKERASVIFWRKLESERTNKIDPIRKIALDQYCERQKSLLKPDTAGNRNFYTSCAIGGINLIGIDVKEPRDIAYVEVVWSGYPSWQKDSEPIVMAKRPLNHKSVFVMMRIHGSKTNQSASLASAHCPSCGAPEQSGAENECAYCGSVMNDGKKEWVLSAVVDRKENSVSAIIERLKNQTATVPTDNEESEKTASKANDANIAEIKSDVSGLDLIRWTVAMMLADGQIDEKEIEMIKNLAIRKDVSEQKLQLVIDTLQQESDPVNYVIDTSPVETDKGLLSQLARVALADGKLSPEENEMLCSVGVKMNMTKMEVNQFWRQERKKMFQEAKELLRRSRTR